MFLNGFGNCGALYGEVVTKGKKKDSECRQVKSFIV